MYAIDIAILLMYGSHDMRHTDFPQVDGGQQDPREIGFTTWYQSLGLKIPRVRCQILEL